MIQAKQKSYFNGSIRLFYHSKIVPNRETNESNLISLTQFAWWPWSEPRGYRLRHQGCPGTDRSIHTPYWHYRDMSKFKRSLCKMNMTWWRHQMETFSALLAHCAGNSPGTGEFPSQRPVTRNFDVFFDLCLTKRLSKQLWGWWFETQSRPLWRHGNDITARIVKLCFCWIISFNTVITGTD